MTGAALDSVGAISDDAALRETIRRRVEAAGTSFYWAMRMLPQERRDGMYAVYAFCREVDDIADDWPEAERAAGLAAWHDEIEAVYAGRPRQLIARAPEQKAFAFVEGLDTAELMETATASGLKFGAGAAFGAMALSGLETVPKLPLHP